MRPSAETVAWFHTVLTSYPDGCIFIPEAKVEVLQHLGMDDKSMMELANSIHRINNLKPILKEFRPHPQHQELLVKMGFDVSGWRIMAALYSFFGDGHTKVV